MKVTFTFEYVVEESTNPDGSCVCGSDPKQFACVTQYGSSKLYQEDDGSYHLDGSGVNTDDVWNNEQVIRDIAGNVVLICEDFHYFVNPHAKVSLE